MSVRDPDDTLLVLFRHEALPNAAKSLAEGRPVCDDVEVCEIRFPGSRDIKPFPAFERSHWVTDPYSGEQTAVTYAERFKRQYQQFKAKQAQTKSGTPLDYLPTLTEARRAELRAQNIYTVEQLAAIDGQELKNLGSGGRDMKNQAEEYLAATKVGAPNLQMAAELEAMRARNAVLEEDAKRRALQPPVATTTEDFDDMTIDQLRDYVTTHTGHAPVGNLKHKDLKRMAVEAKPSKAA